MKETVLGCLPYLNVRPLIRSIECDTPDGFELIYETPSGLAAKLRDESCDIAAVSSFEALGNPDLVILPDMAIASDGRVSSVLLFSQQPFEQIRTVALDTSSLSGAALTRILLVDLFDIQPDFVRLDPNASAMLEEADACLMIGNNAMLQAPSVPYVLDLGEGWKTLTGLPFVFGLWAARKTAVDQRDVDILQQAKRTGLREIDEIAEEESVAMELPVAVVRNYLAEIMVYDLGAEELAGLTEFCRRGREHGLLPSDAEVRLFAASSDSAGITASSHPAE